MNNFESMPSRLEKLGVRFLYIVEVGTTYSGDAGPEPMSLGASMSLRAFNISVWTWRSVLRRCLAKRNTLILYYLEQW